MASFDQASKRRYFDGLVEILREESEQSLEQLGILYRVFAITSSDAEVRQRALTTISLQRRSRRQARIPSFASRILQLSFAKDALTVARESRTAEKHRRVERLERRLRLSPEELSLLWKWIRWEDTILKTIKHDLRVSLRRIPYKLFRQAEETGFPVLAFYLSGTRVGLAAVGIPRGPAAERQNPMLVALGASAAAAWATLSVLPVSEVRDLPAQILSEGIVQDVRLFGASVKEMVALRERYLCYLAEDNKVLIQQSSVPASPPRKRGSVDDQRSTAYSPLSALWNRDRSLAGAKPLDTGTVKRPTARVNVVVRTLVDLANEQLVPNNPGGESPAAQPTDEVRQAWHERLCELSPYAREIRYGSYSLRDLQREIRDILTNLAAKDSWASSKEYAALATVQKWREPGLEPFAIGSSGVGILPLSGSLHWEWDSNGVFEESFAPWDPRSCVVLALREALGSSDDNARILKCPVCGKFFVPNRRQRYCVQNGRCKSKATEFLRDREKHKKQRRDRYWAA